MSRRGRRWLWVGAVVLVVALWVGLVARTPLGAEARAVGGVAIVGARVVDPRDGSTRELDVGVRDGVIAELAERGELDVSRYGEVVEAEGRFVSPGLIDLHAHMFRAGYCSGDEGVGWVNIQQMPMNFDVALASGVTTVLDLGGPLAPGVSIRDALRAEQSWTPRMLVAGPVLTTVGGYPLDWADHDMVSNVDAVVELADPEQARRQVARLAASGVDAVKIVAKELGYNERQLPMLPQPVFDAAVAEAHTHGLRVFVHAHTNAGYRAALAAGADVIAHSTFEPLPDDVIAEVVRTQTPVIPTLWVFAAFEAHERDPTVLAEIEHDLLAPIYADVEDFARRSALSTDLLPDDFQPDLRKARISEALSHARDNLRRLHAAGARIAFGTDTAFCYATHGSAARELQEMVAAGLSPAAALASATVGAAAALGRDDLGVIARGASADLVVLDSNPATDPAAFASPALVVARGRVAAGDVQPPRTLRAVRWAWELGRALYL